MLKLRRMGRKLKAPLWLELSDLMISRSDTRNSRTGLLIQHYSSTREQGGMESGKAPKVSRTLSFGYVIAAH